MEKVKFIHSNQ